MSLAAVFWLSPAAKEVLSSVAQVLKGKVPCSHEDLAKALTVGDAAASCKGLLADAKLRQAFATQLQKSTGQVDKAGELLTTFEAVLKVHIEAIAKNAGPVAAKLKKGAVPSFKEVAALTGKPCESLKKDWLLWHSCGNGLDKAQLPVLDDAVLRERISLAAVAGEGAVVDVLLAQHVFDHLSAYVAWEKTCPNGQVQAKGVRIGCPFDKVDCDNVALRRMLSNALPVEIALEVSEAMAGGKEAAAACEAFVADAKKVVVMPLYIAPPAPKKDKGATDESKKGKDEGKKNKEAKSPKAKPTEAPKAAAKKGKQTAEPGIWSATGANKGFASSELRWSMLRYTVAPKTALSGLPAPAATASAATPVSASRPLGFPGTWTPTASAPLPPGHTVYSWSHVKAQGMSDSGFTNAWAPNGTALPPGHTNYSWEMALAAPLAKEAKAEEKLGAKAAPKTKTEPKVPAEKKDKKEAPAAPAQTDGEQPLFSKLEVRVGKVVDAWHHPEADRLFVEKIDVGEKEPRQIVSGLREHYTLEQFKGRMLLVICNMKPVKLVKVDSSGMVLCAKVGDKVELLDVPKDAKIGDRVLPEGVVGTWEPAAPNAVSKKKIWDAVAKELKTDGNKVACSGGAPLVFPSGAKVQAPSLPNAQIS